MQLAMSPLDKHRFAAALENGTVMIWDDRQPKQPEVRSATGVECRDAAKARASPYTPRAHSPTSQRPKRRIHAHEGPAYAVAWHPYRSNRLASGGRDAFIRVW
jgi:WD40 repeat protein